jgi:hypothetical protein
MPARNAEHTIGEALRSTLRDLPRDAELLVLDDASTDATRELASSTGDKRVEVIASEHRLGVARAAELLLARASGELVARMDSDDVCLRGRFQAERAAIDGGADVVFSTFQVIGAGIRRPVPPIRFGPDAARLALLLDCPYPHSTLFARTSVLRAAGGYRPDAVAEDYDLWLRASTGGAVLARLARPTVLIRKSPGQVTAAPGWRASLANGVDESYRAFAASVWGVDSTPWFAELAFTREGALSRDGRAIVEPFVSRFLASLGDLSPMERWSLARRARQELGKRAR